MTSPSAPLRLVLAGLVALGLLALAPVAGPAQAGARAARPHQTADAPRVGFSLRRDGTAAGAWFGSRKVDGQVVFRIDPRRAAYAPGFTRARWAATLDGSGPVDVTRARTRRAAWVLAKYGVYRDKVQSAAVELALDVLLHGGAYGESGAGNRRRLDQTGDSATILGMVDYMLSTSRLLAGPYRVTVAARGVTVGDAVDVGVEVTTSATDEPVRKLPVEITLGGRTASGVTRADGSVDLSVAATQPGPQPLVVTVRLLPTDRLLVRRPTGGHGSRVVVAGRKESRTLRRALPIRARPTVALNNPATALLTDALPGTLAVAGGYASSRQATFSLHGPFAAGAAQDCTPATVAATAHLSVSADGSYDVPALTVKTPGGYNWSVALAGDQFNLPASGCGRTFTAKTVPILDVAATKTSIPLRGDAKARVDAGRLPADYDDRARVRLYGPFDSRDAVRCNDAHLARKRDVALLGPSSHGTTEPATLQSRGVFAWRATLPGGPLSVGVTTACGAPGSFVRVG